MRNLKDQNSQKAIAIIMGVPLNEVTNMCKSLCDADVGSVVPFTIVKTKTGNYKVSKSYRYGLILPLQMTHLTNGIIMKCQHC